MPIKRTLTIELPVESEFDAENHAVEIDWKDAETLLNDLAEALNKHIVSEAPRTAPSAFDPPYRALDTWVPADAAEGHTDPLSLEDTGRGSPMTYDKGVPPIKRGAMAEIAADEELTPQTKAELEAYYGRKAPGEQPAQMPDDEWAALRAARQNSAPGFDRDVGSSPGGSDRQRSS